MHDWSVAMLAVSFVFLTILLGLYGFLQPWWRSRFGISFVLIMFSLWLMILRILGVLAFGWWQTQQWVSVVGLTELAIGTGMAAFSLGWELIEAWRAQRPTETGPGAPKTPSRMS